MLAALGLLACQAAAFWPVWRWYVLRMSESPEGIWGAAALAGAVAVLLRGLSARLEPVEAAGCPVASPKVPIRAAAALTGLYAASYPFLPALPRAILALAALCSLLPALGLRRTGSRASHCAFHVLGFLLLSLPAIPTAQFFLGYPLRLLAGAASALLLNLAGYPVVSDGVLLDWQGRQVLIDAPCSGIRMLWAGLLLSLALSATRKLGPMSTLLLAAVSVAAVVAANVLRSAALFFIEAGVVAAPAWAHGAVGALAFLAACAALAALAPALGDSRRPPGGKAAICGA
jgi:exosortase